MLPHEKVLELSWHTNYEQLELYGIKHGLRHPLFCSPDQ